MAGTASRRRTGNGCSDKRRSKSRLYADDKKSTAILTPAMLKPNFRTKVLAPVIIVMILLVAATVFVVNSRIMRQFQTEAQHTLATADTVFQNLQSSHSDDLELRFHG